MAWCVQLLTTTQGRRWPSRRSTTSLSMCLMPHASCGRSSCSGCSNTQVRRLVSAAAGCCCHSRCLSPHDSHAGVVLVCENLSGNHQSSYESETQHLHVFRHGLHGSACSAQSHCAAADAAARPAQTLWRSSTSCCPPVPGTSRTYTLSLSSWRQTCTRCVLSPSTLCRTTPQLPGRAPAWQSPVLSPSMPCRALSDVQRAPSQAARVQLQCTLQDSNMWSHTGNATAWRPALDAVPASDTAHHSWRALSKYSTGSTDACAGMAGCVKQAPKCWILHPFDTTRRWVAKSQGCCLAQLMVGSSAMCRSVPMGWWSGPTSALIRPFRRLQSTCAPPARH